MACSRVSRLVSCVQSLATYIFKDPSEPVNRLRPLLLATLLLAGCAALFTPADPRPVEAISAEAEDLVRLRNYAGAADLYARAIARQPNNSRHYLRRAELQEALGRDRDARATYRAGLEKLAADAPGRLEVMQRLALLAAEHLQDIDTAEELLAQLPAGSLARIDLAGYLYFQANQHELAIEMFNKALNLAGDDNDQKAIVLYHAALVYDSLQDEKNAVSSLFHAINSAEHLGLIRDISALWARISASEPLPQSKASGR